MTYNKLVPVWTPGALDDRPSIRDEIVPEPHGQNRQPILGDRENEVFGTSRIWPDEIAVPYSVFFGAYEARTRVFNGSQGTANLASPRLGGEALSEIKYTDALASEMQVIQPGGALPAQIFLNRNHRAIDRRELEPRAGGPGFEVLFTPWFQASGSGHVFDVNMGGPSVGNEVGGDIVSGPWLVQVEWQETDAAGVPIGGVNQIDFVENDGTLEERIWTLSINAFSVLGAPGFVRVRIGDFQGPGGQNFLSSNKFWHSFVARTAFFETPFVDSTIAVVTLRSAQSNTQLDDPFSVLALRNLPFTVDTAGNIIGPSPQFTQQLTDILFHLATAPDHGNMPHEMVDTVALGQLRAALAAIPGATAGQCNVVFNSQASVGDELELVANLGRIIPTRHGEFLTFYRDQAQTVPTTIINNRSKTAYESVDFEYDPDLVPDGVEVRFVDPDQDFTEQRVVYPFTSPQVNLRRMELDGGNANQAIRRAAFEYLRQTEATMRASAQLRREGRFLRILQRVVMADELQPASYSGECQIMGSNVLLVDRDLPDLSNQTLWLRGRDGVTVQELRVSAQLGRTIETVEPITLLPPAQNAELGLLFSLVGPANDTRQRNWMVNAIMRSGDGAHLELAEYKPDIYRIADEDPLDDNVISRHEPWLVEYTSDSVVAPGDPFPALSNLGATLDVVGTAPIVATTAPMLDAGIGSRRVERALGNPVLGGFAQVQDVPVTISDRRTLWTRVIFRTISAAPTGHVFQMVTISPSTIGGATRFEYISGSSAMRVRWGDNGSGFSNSDVFLTTLLFQWQLVDIIQDPTTGRLKVLQNGEVVESTTVDPGRRIPGPIAQLGVLSNRNGNTAAFGYEFAWLGWKHIANIDFLTRDAHVLDVEALGLPVLPE